VDEALPTTAALTEHSGVSQATITRVLRARAAEGLVSTVPRWGRCQLLEVGFERSACWSAGPPRTAGNAQRIAAGHVVFDEGLSRVLDIAASLMETPIWAFWWTSRPTTAVLMKT